MKGEVDGELGESDVVSLSHGHLSTFSSKASTVRSAERLCSANPGKMKCLHLFRDADLLAAADGNISMKLPKVFLVRRFYKY